MIQIKDLSKNFGLTTVLKDVSLFLSKDQTTVLLGPSGSGKSTLLRCIARLEQFDSGKIYFQDKEIKTNKQLKKIGLIFQNFNLFPHFSILKNLIYAPLLLNTKSTQEELVAKASKILLQLGIKDKIHSSPKELSGGQKQRVAIARALMLEPQVLLFDEPTSALDRESVALLIKIINELKPLMTMLIVSHEIDFARSVADSVAFIEKGMLLCHQKTESFFQDPDSYRAKLFLE